MTSGNGIAHSERTPAVNTGHLNGVQLWTALPDEHRHATASFQHLAEVPYLEFPGGAAHVFSGALENVISPAEHYSELLGADLEVHPKGALSIPLRPNYEYAVLVLRGDCSLDGHNLDGRVLYYLGRQRSEAKVTSSTGARMLLIGGPPFPETILMWWNFVARTPEEIRDARMDWEEHRRFGEVTAYSGPRLAAPDLMRLARPNPLS
jgi:redox-sensitive bicupin YhaK (pirin superfamily)